MVGLFKMNLFLEVLLYSDVGLVIPSRIQLHSWAKFCQKRSIKIAKKQGFLFSPLVLVDQRTLILLHV